MNKLLLLFDFGCLSLALYLLKRLVEVKSRRAPLPPGPPGLPLIGNLRDWPTSKAWFTFTAWAGKYGDLVHANVAGTHIVIVNSAEKASVMLQTRGVIYSGRPSSYFAGEMVGWKNLMTLQEDGPSFRAGRRMFAQEIGTKKASDRFAPMSQAKTRDFIRRILDNPSPKALSHHVRTLTSAVILDLTYGYQVKDDRDEFVDIAERAMDIFTEAAAPGAYLVDSLPWLARLPPWLPGTGFMEEAKHMRRVVSDFVERPFQFVRDQLAAGTASSSFVANNLEHQVLTPSAEEDIKWTAVGLFAGGSDTTVSSIYSFFLFMLLYPDVQERAQAEIDAVIGHDRLPAISDRPHLPYVDALVKEVFRFGQITPQGVPHRVCADDVFDGYFIPKDTLIITNTWFMARDPRTYKKPHIFDPSRFLGDEPELDPRTYIFGFGRRICPGRLFADDNMFLACAVVLATLNISKAVDATGQEITPPIEYIGTLVTHPKQFPCDIRPRSSQAETLVRTPLDL